jgi:hypothetical protein
MMIRLFYVLYFYLNYLKLEPCKKLNRRYNTDFKNSSFYVIAFDHLCTAFCCTA